MKRIYRQCSALLLGAGCALGCSHDEYLDEGTVMLTQSEDGTLLVEVVADACYSAGGSELESAACSVTVADATLIVRSRIIVEEQKLGTTDSACRLYSAKCAVPELLPAGRYTLRLGQRTGKVTVPLESDCVPLGDGPAAALCRE